MRRVASTAESERGESVLDAFARDALRMIDDLPGVGRIGLAVSEGGGRRLLFTSSDRLAANVLEWCAIEASAHVPLTLAAREGRSTLGSLDDLESTFPDFVAGQREAGVLGVAAVPLVAAGRRLGGVVLYVEEPGALERLRSSALAGHLRRVGEGIGERLVALRVEHRRRPDPTGDGTVAYEMADSPADVAQARRFLRTHLVSLAIAPEVVDDAGLCLTELATNAIVHTHGGCRVEVACEPDLLVVRVIDEGGLGTARMRDPDEVATVGRGLQIVAALADRSGRDEDRRTSWFEFDLVSLATSSGA